MYAQINYFKPNQATEKHLNRKIIEQDLSFPYIPWHCTVDNKLFQLFKSRPFHTVHQRYVHRESKKTTYSCLIFDKYWPILQFFNWHTRFFSVSHGLT